MRLVTRLYLSIGLLLAFGIGLAVLAMWTSERAAFLLEREHLAHRSYEAHLALSNHTYQLFKQFGDARSIGDLDRGKGEAELTRLIRADIAAIRSLIASEIELTGMEELEELERLAKIEREIDALFTEHEAILKYRDRASLPNYWRRLSRMLDDWIDRDFNALIQAALDEEAREVRETRERAAVQVSLTRSLAATIALLAIAAALASVWLLLRSILRPVDALHRGARALAAGNLDHQVDESGPREFGELARAFNRMAAEIAAREAALSDSNARLEGAVAQRTAELERLLETVRENDRNRKRLLADVSHELRTPLTIIRGEAEVALRGSEKSPDAYREALQKTRDAAVHTSRLVDDLLFIARREAGEFRLKREFFDLVATIRDCVVEFDGLARQHRARIRFAEPAVATRVHADPGRIRQVVSILLENAVRYGGDRITISLAPLADALEVTVEDNGPGLSADEAARAFDRFYRGANAAERYAQGTGLGLPVARAIVEAHEGSITLASEPGRGTRVSFTLPARARLQAVS